MADRDMHGKYSLELYDTGRYMRLDAAAQRALNVLKSKTDANDNFSLYGLLNRARSAMGKRLLKVRRQPSILLARRHYCPHSWSLSTGTVLQQCL